MRSILIMVAGIALFGLTVLAVPLVGGEPDEAIDTAVKIFLPSWFLLSGVSAWYGVRRIGYPVSEEIQIAIVVFLIPAAVAGIVWWRFPQ